MISKQKQDPDLADLILAMFPRSAYPDQRVEDTNANIQLRSGSNYKHSLNPRPESFPYQAQYSNTTSDSTPASDHSTFFNSSANQDLFYNLKARTPDIFLNSESSQEEIPYAKLRKRSLSCDALQNIPGLDEKNSNKRGSVSPKLPRQQKFAFMTNKIFRTRKGGGADEATSKSNKASPASSHSHNNDDAINSIPLLIRMAECYSCTHGSEECFMENLDKMAPKARQKIIRKSLQFLLESGPEDIADLSTSNASIASKNSFKYDDSLCVFISGNDNFKMNTIYDVHNIPEYDRHLREGADWCHDHFDQLDVNPLKPGLDSITVATDISNLDPNSPRNSPNISSSTRSRNNSCLNEQRKSFIKQGQHSLDSNPEAEVLMPSNNLTQRIPFDRNRRVSAPSAVMFRNRGRSMSLTNLIPDYTINITKNELHDLMIESPGYEPRRLLFEGAMKFSKRGSKAHNRYLFICSDILLIGKKKTDPSSSVFTLKQKLDICHVWQEEAPLSGESSPHWKTTFGLAEESNESSMEANSPLTTVSVDLHSATSFVIGWPPNEQRVLSFPGSDETRRAWDQLDSAIKSHRYHLKDLQYSARVLNKILKENKQEVTVPVSFDWTMNDLKEHVIKQFAVEDKSEVEIYLSTDEGNHSNPIRMKGCEIPCSIIHYYTKDYNQSFNSSFSNSPKSLPSEITADQIKILFILARKSTIDSEDLSNQGKKKSWRDLFSRNNPTKKVDQYVLNQQQPDNSRVFGQNLDKLWPNGVISPSIMSLLALINKYRDVNVGLFRTCPSKQQTDNLTKELEESDEPIKDDPVMVKAAASTLKRFIREIPDGLLQWKTLSDTWKEMAIMENNEERFRRMSKQLFELPKVNQRLLKALLCLLFQIAEVEEFNKMSPSALSTILTPNIGFVSPASIQHKTDLDSLTSLFEWMIKNAENLMTKQEKDQIIKEFHNLISPNMEEHSSDPDNHKLFRSADDLSAKLDHRMKIDKNLMQSSKTSSVGQSRDSGLNLRNYNHHAKLAYRNPNYLRQMQQSSSPPQALISHHKPLRLENERHCVSLVDNGNISDQLYRSYSPMNSSNSDQCSRDYSIEEENYDLPAISPVDVCISVIDNTDYDLQPPKAPPRTKRRTQGFDQSRQIEHQNRDFGLQMGYEKRESEGRGLSHSNSTASTITNSTISHQSHCTTEVRDSTSYDKNRLLKRQDHVAIESSDTDTAGSSSHMDLSNESLPRASPRVHQQNANQERAPVRPRIERKQRSSDMMDSNNAVARPAVGRDSPPCTSPCDSFCQGNTRIVRRSPKTKVDERPLTRSNQNENEKWRENNKKTDGLFVAITAQSREKSSSSSSSDIDLNLTHSGQASSSSDLIKKTNFLKKSSPRSRPVSDVIYHSSPYYPCASEPMPLISTNQSTDFSKSTGRLKNLSHTSSDAVIASGGREKVGKSQFYPMPTVISTAEPRYSSRSVMNGLHQQQPSPPQPSPSTNLSSDRSRRVVRSGGLHAIRSRSTDPPRIRPQSNYSESRDREFSSTVPPGPQNHASGRPSSSNRSTPSSKENSNRRRVSSQIVSSQVVTNSQSSMKSTLRDNAQKKSMSARNEPMRGTPVNTTKTVNELRSLFDNKPTETHKTQEITNEHLKKIRPGRTVNDNSVPTSDI